MRVDLNAVGRAIKAAAFSCSGAAMIYALLAAASLIAPQSAHAQSCFQGPTTNLAFGTVGPAGSDTSGSVSITCQKPWTANVSPTYFRMCLYVPGGVPINTLNPRRMTNYNGGEMRYEIFSDAARTQRIGDGAPAPIYSITLLINQAGSVQSTATFPVYGRVYPGQALPVGNYQSQNYATIRWVSSTTGYPPVSACPGGAALANIYQGVSATWENSCAILSVNDLSFGPHDNLTAQRDGQTTMSITCPTNMAWQVSLNNGQNFASGSRRMRNAAGTAFIRYGLFRNAARTQAWGATLGTNTVGGTGTGFSQSLNVYGRVPAQATPAGGSYEDNVVMTLTY